MLGVREDDHNCEKSEAVDASKAYPSQALEEPKRAGSRRAAQRAEMLETPTTAKSSDEGGWARVEAAPALRKAVEPPHKAPARKW
jgi:hypothetical protein